MEAKFLAAWQAARQKAAEKGIRLRPLECTLAQAHRQLGRSRPSDGFDALAEKGQLALSLEALVIDKRFTALFTDAEANVALEHLLFAGYRF